MKNLRRKSTSPHKHQGFGYVASLLAVASVVGSANVANAATFSFSFTNEPGEGNINGTVEGIIELPDGDGIFAATSVVVTSAPIEVLPPDGTEFALAATFNSFQVIDGALVSSTVDFLSTVNNFNLDIANVDITGTTDRAALTNNITGDIVSSANNNSLTFTPVVPTPEPTFLLALMGVGVLGVASKLKKKA